MNKKNLWIAVASGAALSLALANVPVLNLVNILLFVLALAIHFRIVIREEEFLEQRFGQRWIEYRNRVPRYLGRVRQPGA